MKITLIIIKNQSNIHTCGVNCACKHLNYLVAIGLLYLLFSFWMMTITAQSYLCLAGLEQQFTFVNIWKYYNTVHSSVCIYSAYI